MGVFEPNSVRQQCAATIDDKKARLKFVTSWKKNVSGPVLKHSKLSSHRCAQGGTSGEKLGRTP